MCGEAFRNRLPVRQSRSDSGESCPGRQRIIRERKCVDGLGIARQPGVERDLCVCKRHDTRIFHHTAFDCVSQYSRRMLITTRDEEGQQPWCDRSPDAIWVFGKRPQDRLPVNIMQGKRIGRGENGPKCCRGGTSRIARKETRRVPLLFVKRLGDCDKHLVGLIKGVQDGDSFGPHRQGNVKTGKRPHLLRIRSIEFADQSLPGLSDLCCRRQIG
ncbi:MAG: hypothetical protein KDE06_01340, partial [Rhodobacteraceae bacterium]|nr:hypothetical protein [Paracoccaceae bacterium]MCB2143939.1 hypothetical protein [Paracoccaceae bacterium]MCB2149971.1 hypothetical protein [Paracoccaceae bacterium]MCB2157494.1 hypothetical protein [Paracoccaceae bacterium]